jgi:glycosyltransferase involved in cell wall biosynthesis
MHKIIIISDISETGSGYKNIALPIAEGLTKFGHEIKVVGLGYKGAEHNYPFSIIPAGNYDDCFAVANNLFYLWQADTIIVALDLPLQSMYSIKLAPLKMKYIAITPLENGPLTLSWAAPLFNIDGVFFISELGKQEAIKVGVTKAEHLLVGVDTVTWHPATKEEKLSLRKGMGIPEDAFVVMTVAANQERKNLWAAFSAIQKLKQQMPDRVIKYVLVSNTKEGAAFGWNLQDLAVSMGINTEVMIFERGMPTKDLWGIYSMADVYLQTSKAEGLGMPVLEAMACKIPVVATDTGALHELLQDGRGLLVKSAFQIVDVWGNSYRDFIDTDDTVLDLDVVDRQDDVWTDKALKYVQERVWSIPIQQIQDKIKEIFNEQ